jgi:hypothetical protein
MGWSSHFSAHQQIEKIKSKGNSPMNNSPLTSPSVARRFGCISITGCLASLVGGIMILGFIAGIFYLIASEFKSSPVYMRALAAVQSDARVIQALGAPIQPGWYVTGSLEEQGLSGDATLTIPVSGSRKGGMLYASARKANGVWVFYTLAVQVDGDDNIITLNPAR